MSLQRLSWRRAEQVGQKTEWRSGASELNSPVTPRVAIGQASGAEDCAGCGRSVCMRDRLAHANGFHPPFLFADAIAGIEWVTVCMGQSLRAVLDASREGKSRFGAVEFS